LTQPVLDSKKTPFFAVDRVLLQKNMDVVRYIKQNSGARVLLALKGFAMFSTFPFLRETLDGSCASSPHEARLSKEDFAGEVHSYAAAFSMADMEEIVTLSDHVSLNSISQYERFLPLIKQSQGRVSFGLRINPGHSESDTEIYDPCAPNSRLGITLSNFPERLPGYIEGLHFHSLCEKNSDSLERTLAAVEKNFGHLLGNCKWMNFGGGHHISREDYDLDLLCSLINRFMEKYDLQVYIEPGEGIALNTGFLHATVLDVINNGMNIAILDTSAATHMPDVLEMPYRPYIIGSGKPGELNHTYRLGGPSCLAGDIIGDYSFTEELKVGDRLTFTDMAHYSMVKTNTFNGIQLPSIYFYDSKENVILHEKTFGYGDFRGRLS